MCFVLFRFGDEQWDSKEVSNVSVHLPHTAQQTPPSLTFYLHACSDLHWSQPGEKKLTGGTNWQPRTAPSTTWNPANMVSISCPVPASLVSLLA